METLERFQTTVAAAVVWQVLVDVEHWKSWTPTIVDITPLTRGGMEVGAQFRVVQPGLKPAVYEVIAFTPNEGFAWIQRLPGGGFVADHRLSARNGLTEVELSFRSEGLFAAVASRVFASKIRRFVATEARSLKQRCESTVQTPDAS